MKKIILTALLFAGLATAGFSQTKQQHVKKTPEQRAQHMTDALSKKLSLTEQQKNEIYRINLDRANQIEKLHASGQKHNKQDFQKGKKEFEESDSKILSVLNADQKVAYQELKAQRQNKMRGQKGDFRKGKKDQKGKA